MLVDDLYIKCITCFKPETHAPLVIDAQTLLGPGGLLVVPPNTMYWGEVVADEAVLNPDVFTPQLPEYA